VSPREPVWERGLRSWLQFWFELPSVTALAFLRIATGIVLFYSLFVYSFDLTAHLSSQGWGDLSMLRQNDPVAWPYSLFDWVESAWWMWIVHCLAILAAGAFALGVFPPLTGSLSLLFYLSYGHRNPAVMVDLDALLVMLLIYLVISPCGRVMALVPHIFPEPRRNPLLPPEPNPPRPAWGAFMLRLLQLQLCLLYFLSGLSSMFPEWLSGSLLIQPGLAERGLPLGIHTFRESPVWPIGIAHLLTLLSLFYPLLVWLPRFRYSVLAALAFAHFLVGVMWGTLAFNVLMMSLQVVFVSDEVLEWVRHRAGPLLTMPWLPSQPRP
jgi:hypothetical protein